MENSCSACVHFIEDLDYFLSVLFLRRATSLLAFDLWLRPWGVAQLVGLHGVSPGTISKKWLSAPTMWKVLDREAFSIQIFLSTLSFLPSCLNLKLEYSQYVGYLILVVCIAVFF